LLPQMNTTGISYDVNIATSYIDTQALYPQPQPMQSIDLNPDYADPDYFVFSSFHSAGYYSSKQSYNNSIMDDLIMQGRIETDPTVRQQIYNQIQELAAHDRPAIWLYSPKEFTTFRAWLKGIGLRFQPMSAYYYIYHIYKDYST
ncbi:MAG: hypothetical protein ACFFCP_09685, partial [Promethearchaeota archaeon]